MTNHTQILDPVEEGKFLIRTDPHCHIIPGIDDGSPDIGMSIRMARLAASLGVRNIVATPHGNHPALAVQSDPDFLRSETAKLNRVFQDEGIPIRVYPGTEIFLSEQVPGLLEKNRFMTWADQGRHVLIELGFQDHCPDIVPLIRAIQALGLTVIIAHPERYLWLDREPEIFDELNSLGCLFQFNTMSINGHFGTATQNRAATLIGKARQMLVGTDSHHDAMRYFEFPQARNRVNLWGGNVSAP